MHEKYCEQCLKSLTKPLPGGGSSRQGFSSSASTLEANKAATAIKTEIIFCHYITIIQMYNTGKCTVHRLYSHISFYVFLCVSQFTCLWYSNWPRPSTEQAKSFESLFIDRIANCLHCLSSDKRDRWNVEQMLIKLWGEFLYMLSKVSIQKSLRNDSQWFCYLIELL